MSAFRGPTGFIAVLKPSRHPTLTFQVSRNLAGASYSLPTTKMTSSIPSASDITKEHFWKILGQYDELIENLSASKPPKSGGRTLQELDQFRYRDAVDVFSSPKSKRPMTHDDVKTLVEWKLRHGKFRPSLMNLVSSNDSAKVADTIRDAMTAYWKGKDADAALKAITAMKGVGPATAALLLSVHDPDNVIFFSDEAYWWLCCSGQKESIKYNPKEYQALRDATQGLRDRLGAGAMDIEKVAYVMYKGEPAQEGGSEKETEGVQGPKSSSAEKIKKSKGEATEPATEKAKAKRKPNVDTEDPPAGVRRSKRGKT